jgi:hypothetical protein
MLTGSDRSRTIVSSCYPPRAAGLHLRWGELSATIDGGGFVLAAIVVANPVGVDMGKVAATVGVVDRLRDVRTDIETVLVELARASLFSIT